MILLGWAGVALLVRGTIERSPIFLRACLAMTPAGFVAILAGWVTAEVGRQPWTVFGLMRTAESTSPITADSVGMSLTVYVFTYFIIFSAGLYYMLRIAAQGPDTAEPEPATPALAAWMDLHPGAPREGVR
jgi:cytochrome d ubiquinol oxidase subunit I